MIMKRIHFVTSVIAGLALNLCVVGQAISDVQISNLPDALESLSIGGGTEQYFYNVKNAFGVDGEDYNFVDGAFKLHTHAKLKNDIEFKFGLVYAGTFGDDFYSSAYSWGALPVGYEGNNSDRLDVDDAWIKVNEIAGLPIDITLGKQRIVIEKSFLMSEQSMTFDTNVYGNAFKSSPFGALVDVHLDPVTVSAYWARIDTDDDMAEFLIGDDVYTYGLNTNYQIKDNIYAYAGVIDYKSKTDYVFDDESITFYLGLDATFGGFNLQGEFAQQIGEESISDVDRDAQAGFGFLKYTFENVSMTPFIEIGGWFFSGDDPDTDDNEAFNTMTVGFPDWGKWCPGEIFGEQVFFGLSNYRTLSAQVGIMPKEYLSIRLQYFQTSWLEEDNVFGASVSDDKASDEFNLVFEIFPNENLYAGIILGVAVPDSGLEDVFGDDKVSYLAVPFMAYTF